jgi:aldehyde:ferredoxin oxidoreductase
MPPDQWAKASQQVQLVNAAADSSGFCQFLQPTLTDIAAFYGDFVGEDVSPEQVADIGWQCLQDEWAFNRGAGFTAADDTMPECIMKDPIGPQNLVWDVDPALVAQAYQRFPNDEKLLTTKASG